MITLEVTAPVHPTESEAKVEKALKNVFPSVEFYLSGGHFTGMSTDVESLIHFKELLEVQRIRDTANTILKRFLTKEGLIFYLNKQAAFMEKVNFSEECPLDPIVVSIKGKDLHTLINHLSPRTVEQ